MDWHTDSYKLNNWYKNNAAIQSAGWSLPQSYWSNQYASASGSLTRIICLNSGGTHRKWATKDGSYSVTFYKNFKAVKQDATGTDSMYFHFGSVFGSRDSTQLSISLYSVKTSVLYSTARTYAVNYEPYHDKLYLDNRVLSPQ
jgi:hypothetical protein